MIVSNPPYIDEADPHLAQGDVRFEPKTALVAADGGWPIWRISSAKDAVSAARRLMLLEHGWTQGEAVRALFREAGYRCRDLPRLRRQ
jgi:release factor glutamine methyltransferase